MATATLSVDVLLAKTRARPDDVEAWCDLASALLAEGRAAAAHGFAARAAERAMDARPARVLAAAHVAQDRVGDARAVLHEALRRWPKSAGLHQDLATLHAARGDSALAAAHQTCAAATTPATAAAAAQALIPAYIDALALAPGDLDVLALLAREHLAIQHYAAAGQLCVRMLEIDASQARAILAQHAAQLAATTNSDMPDDASCATAYQQRGLLHYALQQLDRAKTCFERALLHDAAAAFAAAMLAAINARLNLPPNHSAFAADARQNAADNAAELAARATVLTSSPTHIELASTNVCNIDPPCVQCWKHIDPVHGWLHGDARHMPPALLDSVAPMVRRAGAVSLHGIGEPLANPHLFDAVRWCDDTTRVSFVSNALILDATRIDRVLTNHVSLISFSLDAGTAATYRKIRHHDFDKAIGNIRRLIAERDRRGLDRPQIAINMCLMRENLADIPAFVRLAHELGVTSAHMFHMNHGAHYKYDWFDYAEQMCEKDPETHDYYVEAGFALAAKLGVPLVMSGRRRLSVPDATRTHVGAPIDIEQFFCAKPWQALLVQTNGDVFNCCWQARPLGNVEHGSVWQIWNSPLLQELRATTAAGVPHPVCEDSTSPCPYLGRV